MNLKNNGFLSIQRFQLQGIGISDRIPVLIRIRQIAEPSFFIAHEKNGNEAKALFAANGHRLIELPDCRFYVFVIKRINKMQFIHHKIMLGSQLHLDSAESIILDGMHGRKLHVVVSCRLKQYCFRRRVFEKLQLIRGEPHINTIDGQIVIRSFIRKRRS